MKKKLALLTQDIETKDRYLKELKTFFEGFIEIDGYSIKEGILKPIAADLVLVTTPILIDYAKKYLMEDMKIICMKRTFLKDKLAALYELPPRTSVMLVSNSNTVAYECMSVLYEIGIKHIDIIPVFPGMVNLPDCKIAITPGQLKYIPDFVERVIDIDWRTLDLSTLMDVATELDILNGEIEEKIGKYANTIIPISHGLHFAFNNSSRIRSQMEIALNAVEDGVMVTDKSHKIVYFNQAICKIFDTNVENMEYNTVADVIPQRDMSEILDCEGLENKLIKIDKTNKSVVLTKRPIEDYFGKGGSVFIIKDTTEIENLGNQLRRELVKKGHVAKYKFENIIGFSEPIKNCIHKARLIAQNDFTVLISGESGTGKELFAQSIHNGSNRKHNPFIALNCAALPSQLLESELFGYEEGSFTGAKKGGKKGLFELAHEGTLFLDEIGDMPISIQVKILRVLQEKEVMKIGGNSIIPVDVRVIAATNKDLKALIKEGKFRIDLYYRLNVFNLRVLPLRERKSDIPYLIEDILDEIGMRHKIIDGRLMDVLMNHSWEGNVRELRNCIEYMAYMGQEILTENDLPPDMEYNKERFKEVGQCILFPELLPRENAMIGYLLETLRQGSCGRRSVLRNANNDGIATTEYELRKLIEFLQEKGYINCVKGRNGMFLTKKGKLLIEEK